MRFLPSIRKMGRDDFMQASRLILFRCMRLKSDQEQGWSSYVLKSVMSNVMDVAEKYNLIPISRYMRKKAETDVDVALAIQRVQRAEVLPL
jgi:hypothetical protein